MSDVSYVTINGTTYELNDATSNVVIVNARQDMTAEDVANLRELFLDGTPILGVYTDGDGNKLFSTEVSLTYFPIEEKYGFRFVFISGVDPANEYIRTLKVDGTWEEAEYNFYLGAHYVYFNTGFTYAEVASSVNEGRVVVLQEDNADDPTGALDAKGKRIWMLNWFGAKTGEFHVTFSSQDEIWQFSANSPDAIMRDF